MEISIKKNVALILVDIQDGFDEPIWGKRNNPNAESNARRLLDAWRQNNYPVFHVQHLSTTPGSPLRRESAGSAIKEIVRPLSSEPVITKNVNSAFIGTDLEERLHKLGITQLVLAGITADHCVNTSTRMAANLGFEAFLVHDATVAFERKGFDGRQWSADDIHSAALASLHEEFATILSADEIIRQLKASSTAQGPQLAKASG